MIDETTMSNEHTKVRKIFWLGGLTCLILIAYSLITMVIFFKMGAPPDSIEARFSMLWENRLNGLLRLDILTTFALPLYYVLFYSLYVALRNTETEFVTLSTILVFAGLTLVLSAPAVFSYLHLSNQYGSATTVAEKSELVAAGKAILASDTWHGTSAIIGGILLQAGALIISVIMLKSNVFNRITAITGIATHGLDLAHIIIGLFLPAAGVVLMAVAGPLYLVWFPLIGLRLFKLYKQSNG